MLITIAIPIVSFDRLGLLAKEVKSIEAGTYKDIYIVIVVDGNRELYDAIKKKIPLKRGEIILNEERCGWIASINRALKEYDSPYYIYGSDDVFYPRLCIENAMETMKEKFPDGYGVVSLGRRTKCIFGLVGRKWIEHFPDRQMLCPYYTHYGADAEHNRFSREIDKFAYPPDREAQVLHYRLNDKTRTFARKSREKDLALHKNRKGRGRTWGINFDR